MFIEEKTEFKFTDSILLAFFCVACKSLFGIRHSESFSSDGGFSV